MAQARDGRGVLQARRTPTGAGSNDARPSDRLADEVPAAASAGEPCPVCATPRLAAARFCEVCRYDFTTKLAVVAASEATAPASAAPLSVARPTAEVPAAPTRQSAPAPSPGAEAKAAKASRHCRPRRIT